MNLLLLLVLCIAPLEASHGPRRGAGKNRVSIVLNDHKTRRRQKSYHSNHKKRVFRAPAVDEDEVDRLLQRHPRASRESVVSLVAGLEMVPDPFEDSE